MEDKNVNFIERFKKTIIVLVVVIFVSIIGVFGYQFVMQKINTGKFTNYLSENGYKEKKDGTYTKENKDNNVLVRYKALSSDSIISKETYETTDVDYTSISLKYEKNGNVIVGFQYEGYNKYNDYGVLYQTANYKDGDFDCQVVTGKGFESKCDVMKNKATEFSEEVNAILEKNEITAKYVS